MKITPQPSTLETLLNIAFQHKFSVPPSLNEEEIEMYRSQQILKKCQDFIAIYRRLRKEENRTEVTGSSIQILPLFPSYLTLVKKMIDFGDGALLILGLAAFPSDLKLSNRIATELTSRYKNSVYFSGAYLCRKSMLLDLYCKLKRFDDFTKALVRIRNDRYAKGHKILDDSSDDPHPVTAHFINISEDKLSLSLFSHLRVNEHLRNLLDHQTPDSFVSLYTLLGESFLEKGTMESIRKQIARYIRTQSLPKVRDLFVQLGWKAEVYHELLEWTSWMRDAESAFVIGSIMRDMGIELGM